MTARDAEDPLADQVRERVPNLPRCAFVGQTPGERLDQAIHALGRLEQHGAAVGTRVFLVERGDEGLVEQIREQNSLWYRVRCHAGASVVAKRLYTLRLYHTEALVSLPESTPSRIIRASRPDRQLRRRSGSGSCGRSSGPPCSRSTAPGDTATSRNWYRDDTTAIDTYAAPNRSDTATIPATAHRNARGASKNDANTDRGTGRKRSDETVTGENWPFSVGHQNHETAPGHDPARPSEATNNRQSRRVSRGHQRGQRRLGRSLRPGAGRRLRRNRNKRRRRTGLNRGVISRVHHTRCGRRSTRARRSPGRRRGHFTIRKSTRRTTGRHRCRANSRGSRGGRSQHFTIGNSTRRTAGLRGHHGRAHRQGSRRRGRRRMHRRQTDNARSVGGLRRRPGAAVRRRRHARAVRRRLAHAPGKHLPNQIRAVHASGLALPLDPAHLLRRDREAQLPARIGAASRRRRVSFFHH